MVSGVIGKRDQKISFLCFTVSVQLLVRTESWFHKSIYKKWCQHTYKEKLFFGKKVGVWTGKTFLRICLPIESKPHHSRGMTICFLSPLAST